MTTKNDQYDGNIINIFPGVELVTNNDTLNQNSNILISYINGTKVSTLHYRDNQIKDIECNHLIEGFEVKPSESNSKKVTSNTFKVLQGTGYVFAIVLLIFSLFSFSGYVKARIVLTGSMTPAIKTGDVIITTPIKYKTPKIGDVIAYQAKRFNGAPVGVFSHRIIGGDINKGFIVKGDSNKSPDSQRPKANEILGVVIMVIPFIGNLLTPKALFLLVPTFFGFYLILDAMKNVD